MLWPPLSKCCGSAPVSSWCSLFTSVQGQHGEEPGGLTPPPSPPFIVIDTAEAYCYVCSHLKWFFCTICSMTFSTSKLAVSYPKLSAQEKKLIFFYQLKRRKKGGKRRADTSFVFFMVFVPQNKDPQKVAIP